MPVVVKTPDGATLTYYEDITQKEAEARTKLLMFGSRYGRAPEPLDSDLARQIREVEARKNQYGDK